MFVGLERLRNDAFQPTAGMPLRMCGARREGLRPFPPYKKAAPKTGRLLDRIEFDLFKRRHFEAFNSLGCIFLRIFELLLIRFFATDKYEYCKQGD